MQTLAKSLVSGDDCKPLIAPDCFIRAFDSASVRQIEDVAAHTGGATQILAKAYLFPGGTIASDIGSAVAEAQVSDDVKKMLVPGDADASAKANATATHWLQNALTAANDDPIAVLVYVTTDPSQTSSADGQILFVMLKGHKDSAGNYLVSQIVYGDPRQASMASAR